MAMYKLYNTLIFSLILFVHSCVGVINHLNKSEYARMPPLFALDEYNACLNNERGLYCLIKLNLFDDGENPLMNMIHEYSENTAKHYNHSIIERGVCVQEACGKFIDENSQQGEGLTRALGACLNETIWQEYRLQANVSVLHYCDSNGESDRATTLDWIILAAFILIVMVNLVASYYDYAINYNNKTDLIIGNKYILSCSMIRNFKWLTTSQPENPKVQELQFIHFVRSLTSFLMILAHVMFVIGCGYTSNPHDFEKSYELPLYMLIFNGLMIVQIFFIVSGFLLAYNFQIYAEENKVTWFDIPKVMFLRYCRLSPALAVVLAFTATWMRHLGSGPLWKLYVTDSVVADCRSYWWLHLLYINNYVPQDKYCLIQTWHIAADSQIYLIGITACVATMRRGRRLVLTLLLVAGTIVPAIQVWWQDLDGVVIMNPELYYRVVDIPSFHFAHVPGHCNLQSFVLGIAVAYLVYDWQKKGDDLSKNKFFSLVFWLTPPAIALWFYTGQIFYADGERASLLLRMLYAGGHRLVLALITAFFIVGMVLKAPSSFRIISEWRGWLIPSRLSYSVYLLHMNLVHILMATKHQLSWVSFYNVCIAYLGIVFVTYILATPFFLMVEAPFNGLVKMLLESMKPTIKVADVKIKTKIN